MYIGVFGIRFVFQLHVIYTDTVQRAMSSPSSRPSSIPGDGAKRISSRLAEVERQNRAKPERDSDTTISDAGTQGKVSYLNVVDGRRRLWKKHDEGIIKGIADGAPPMFESLLRLFCHRSFRGCIR